MPLARIMKIDSLPVTLYLPALQNKNQLHTYRGLIGNDQINVRQNIGRSHTAPDVLHICRTNCLNIMIKSRTNIQSLNLNSPISPDIHKRGLMQSK